MTALERAIRRYRLQPTLNLLDRLCESARRKREEEG
jgi:hypothetical protein